MRILVTGATGFLGSHVARALAASGDRVRALRRAASPTGLIRDLDLEPAVGDLFDPTSLRRACDGVEAVVHCAAEMGPGAKPGRRLASHLDGTRHLLTAAADAGVRRFVYTSSVASLGFPDPAPAGTDSGFVLMDETRTWRGDPSRWPYGYTKHRTEAAVRQASRPDFETVIVNPALVIGPGDRNRVSNRLIWHMLHGRTPPLVAGGLNVVDVGDVTRGILGALRNGRPGERYLLCGENRTLDDVITTTARVLGVSAPRWRLPLAAARVLGVGAAVLTRLSGRPLGLELLRAAGLYFYYDGTKARRELGLAPPRPYEQAASDSADWYRGHPAS